MSPNVSNSIFIASYLFQILSGLCFQFAPDRIVRAVGVKECLQATVQCAHFVDCVHRMVGGADLAEACGAHELEKVQAGLAVGRARKVRV